MTRNSEEDSAAKRPRLPVDEGPKKLPFARPDKSVIRSLEAQPSLFNEQRVEVEATFAEDEVLVWWCSLEYAKFPVTRVLPWLVQRAH